MRFSETELAGAFVVDPEPVEDERGFFARTYCESEFEARGLEHCGVQCNVSYNRRRGTIRGMHYQRSPHGEAKLVRCTAGAIFDVIVDLRRESATFGRHTCVELTSLNRRMLYVPIGFAHGFQTLQDDAEVFYQMSTPFVPGAGAGLRYDDAALGIDWPEPVTLVSEKDRSYPDFDADTFTA